MPILGLTDKSASFKELGRLRLGIPKKEMERGPKEIGYFRPDFRPDAMDAATAFTQAYGTAPTAIHIRLPFPEIVRCWDAYYMVYNKTGLLGMADGQRWLYLRHNRTGELLVKDGSPQKSDGLPLDENGMPYMPFDKTVPVYSYVNQKGAEVAVYAKPEGRLKVLIPELKRTAFVTVITHSIYNIIHLTEQLAGVAEVGRNIGMTIPLIPMVLTRRKELISVSFDGKKSMQEHYLLNIEIDPAWMEAQFRYLDNVLPGTLQIGAPVSLALPSGYTPTEQETTEDDDYESGPEIPTDQDMTDDELDAHMAELHKAESEPTEPATIPSALEHLANVCNSDGQPYLFLTSAELSNRSIGISKMLAKNGLTAEQKAEYERKQSAIAEILEWRNANHTA